MRADLGYTPYEAPDARELEAMLTAKLLKLCMEKKDVRGSTGTIHYDAGQIRFEAGER